MHGITKAMEYLDKKCTIQDFCLLELMLAGRAAMDVIDHLYTDGVTKERYIVRYRPSSEEEDHFGDYQRGYT